jgi:hypothetical protein
MGSYLTMWPLRSLPLSAGQRSNTARADVHPTVFPIDHDALVLDIRTEHSFGSTLRVTDVVPKHRAFAADFTLCHIPPLFFDD